MHKKKVAILINSLLGGGAERVVSILLHHLQDEFDIHLVLLSPTIEYTIPVDQKITVLDRFPSKSNVLNILKIPILAFKYYRFLRKNKIATSLSLLNRSNFIASCLKILGWGGKVILSERIFTSAIYDNKTWEGKLGQLLVRRLYPKANVIVCNSKNIEKDLREVFKVQTQFKIIYNPIDLTTKSKAHDALPVLASNTFTFVSMGRLNEQKNHSMLIEAASMLSDIDCCVQIIGKGDLRASLENEIQLLKMQKKVILVDHTDTPFKYLEAADCFVLTSNFEGFPNVVLESLAYSLPVIATDCPGGIRELIAPAFDIGASPITSEIFYADHGLLIPIGNAKILADAMRIMYHNHSLRHQYKISNHERAKCFDNFVIMKHFKELLTQN